MPYSPPFAAGLLLCLIAAPGIAGASERGAYDDSHVFKVTRNGSEIGSHRLTFTPTQEGLRVDVAIDLRVGLGRALTFYRYRHTASEIWRDGRLVRLEASTDDDGKAHSVKAEPSGQGLRVRTTAPRQDNGPAESRVAGTDTRTIDMPGNVLPTSHWRRALVDKNQLLNTQLGTLAAVRVERIGDEPVASECGALPATRYRISGELQLELWFDNRDRWVKTRFSAPDGSTVDYTLRCPPNAPSTAQR